MYIPKEQGNGGINSAKFDVSHEILISFKFIDFELKAGEDACAPQLVMITNTK